MGSSVNATAQTHSKHSVITALPVTLLQIALFLKGRFNGRLVQLYSAYGLVNVTQENYSQMRVCIKTTVMMTTTMTMMIIIIVNIIIIIIIIIIIDQMYGIINNNKIKCQLRAKGLGRGLSYLRSCCCQ